MRYHGPLRHMCIARLLPALCMQVAIHLSLGQLYMQSGVERAAVVCFKVAAAPYYLRPCAVRDLVRSAGCGAAVAVRVGGHSRAAATGCAPDVYADVANNILAAQDTT